MCVGCFLMEPEPLCIEVRTTHELILQMCDYRRHKEAASWFKKLRKTPHYDAKPHFPSTKFIHSFNLKSYYPVPTFEDWFYKYFSSSVISNLILIPEKFQHQKTCKIMFWSNHNNFLNWREYFVKACQGCTLYRLKSPDTYFKTISNNSAKTT